MYQELEKIKEKAQTLKADYIRKSENIFSDQKAERMQESANEKINSLKKEFDRIKENIISDLTVSLFGLNFTESMTEAEKSFATMNFRQALTEAAKAKTNIELAEKAKIAKRLGDVVLVKAIAFISFHLGFYELSKTLMLGQDENFQKLVNLETDKSPDSIFEAIK